ncbi:MAG: hypothetical protein ACRCTJ_06385 [Brevinema sp.]
MTLAITIFIFIAYIVILVLSLILLIFVVPLYIKERENNDSHKEKRLHQKDSRITKLLDELAICKNRSRITHIIAQLKYENQQIVTSFHNKSSLKNKAQNILSWLYHFSIEKHISDLTEHKMSSQIYYNKKTKSFQLMIPDKG